MVLAGIQVQCFGTGEQSIFSSSSEEVTNPSVALDGNLSHTAVSYDSDQSSDHAGLANFTHTFVYQTGVTSLL